MTNTWHKSTCPYCGIGCGLKVRVERGKVVDIQGMMDHPVNKGFTCELPLYYKSLFTHNDRLTHPLIRRGDRFTPISWEEVIKYITKKLKDIIQKFGSQSVAFYGGAINLTEEYYLMNKLMKGAIGTNNIECSTRLCMASSAAGFHSTLGADAPPTCYADIEESDLFFIAGNNMSTSMPLIFNRVRAARKENDTKIIVVDPRRTKIASLADIHLQIRPGTDVALNNSLANILLEESLIDEKTIETNYI